MQRMQTFAAATLGLALAGCGGSGGASSGSAIPASPAIRSAAADDATAVGSRPGVASDALAIAALNALGAPLKQLSDENSEEAAPATTPGTGTCNRGVETFVPDRAGDANSQEIEFFYTPNCTHVARDSVRTYTSTGAGAETVTITVKNYGPFKATTPLSVRTTTAQLTGATFGTNGFPIVGDGFAREATSQLTVGASRKVIQSGSEIVVEPAANGSNSFCSDAAAYNAIGIKALAETFGWHGGILSGGTRTQSSTGAVTWTGTHTGTTVDGSIGALALVTGTPNTTCPIATPAYTISGGTAVRASTSTVSVTFFNDTIQSLTIQGASLSGGYSVSVATNDKVWPAQTNYITGSVTHDNAPIASFSVSAFGDGTLTLSQRGLTFTVVDWNVIR